MERVRQRFADWLAARHAPVRGRAALHRRRVYILPTRFGYLLGLTLALMFLGAVNYGNSMAFLLTFLLVGLVANVLWATHRNLVDLEVSVGPAAPVFSGDTARFPLQLRDPGARARYSVGVQRGGQAPVYLDVAPGSRGTARLPVPARRRGRLAPGRLMVFTQFPLGLFHAWSWVHFESEALVYPRPARTARAPERDTDSRDHDGREQPGGNEDFAGLRDHRPGESLRHVAWKAYAREQGLLTKLFAGPAGEALWLDWREVPGDDIEQRLSLLCRLVLDAEREGRAYGLRLPGTEVAPGLGPAQRHRCLEALALFPGGDGPEGRP